MMDLMKTAGLFFLTAVAEIAGCYLPYLWLRQDKSALLLIPAAISLSAFVWLLTLHAFAAGRAYAAYGGMYVAVAVGWLWWIQRMQPTRWDLIGAAVTIAGMTIIVLQPQRI
jgi:small multidrug resistance family-3 protein